MIAYEIHPRAWDQGGEPGDKIQEFKHHVRRHRNTGSSSTIAAAIVGTLLGVRSIAVSVARPLAGQAEWDGAKKHGAELLRRLLTRDD